IIFLTAAFFIDIRYRLIKRHNTKTKAIIYSTLSFGYRNQNLHYKYYVNDSLYRRHEVRPTKIGGNKIFTNKGIPLRKNYSFMVWYNPEHPNRSIIDLERPTEKTILFIQQDAVKKLRKKEDLYREQAVCIIKDLYDKKGVEPLGHILSADLEWYQNLNHNKYTYRKLKKSNLWKTIKTNCSNLIIIGLTQPQPSKNNET
ncbi:MAG: hypothetical protein R6U19_10310, partial [Bacteroidales bacterium]